MSEEEQQPQSEPKPKPKGKGPSTMLNEPQIAPDGHVNLSQEDIDARV